MTDSSIRARLARRLLHFSMSAATALFATICFTVVTLSVVSQYWLASPQAAIGSSMKVCAQVGAGRMGVILFSPHISAYEPPASASCVYIPWSKQFPLWAHRWWFPP